MEEILNILFENQPEEVVNKAEKALLGIIGSPALLLSTGNQDNTSYEILLTNLDRYLTAIGRMKTENITEISLNIGIPVVNKLVYTDDTEISGLYINLLINASDIKTKYLVIPAFINMAGRLSGDEARIVKYFSKKEYIPFISIRKLVERKIGYNEFVNRLTGIEFEIELNNPRDIGIYFENFSAIGLLYTSWSFKETDIDVYNRLIARYKASNPEVAQIMEKDNTDDKLIKGYFNFTGLGKRFIGMMGYEG